MDIRTALKVPAIAASAFFQAFTKSKAAPIVSGFVVMLFAYNIIYLSTWLSVISGILTYIFYAGVLQAKQEKRFPQGRGRQVIEADQAKAAVDAMRPDDDPGVLWGKLRVRTQDATSHFCIVGAVGSGKTLSIRMLMRDQLPRIKPGNDMRAMVYDAKQDMLQVLLSMDLSCPVHVLNPFDTRATAWDIAADITTPATARELANTLVPDEKESQPFFSDAVRELLTAVVIVFANTRPLEWTLRDVLLVMKSKDRLRRVLGSDENVRETVDAFLNCSDITLGSIMATSATKLGPFDAIAAAWKHAKNKISINEWLKSESILVLGNHEEMRTSLEKVNRLFVAITAQKVGSTSESDERRTWFFFDEFREAGKLQGLTSIILRGRSKGCCVVLGFQDIQGVQEVYGEKAGNELVGQCGNKAFLRMESPETAQWASKCVGSIEQRIINRSATDNAQGGTSVTRSEQLMTRAQVMDSEFMELPLPSRQYGLTGIYLVRSVGCYRGQYTPEELNQYLGEIDRTIAPFDAVEPECQVLTRWSKDEEKHLFSTKHVEEPSHSPNGKPRHGLDDIERMAL